MYPNHVYRGAVLAVALTVAPVAARAESPVDLGTLGGEYSIANAVSGNGSVIVGRSPPVGAQFYHAFKYANGVMIDLGTLGGLYSNATAVSADGSVIVGLSPISGTDISFFSHAFKYANGVMTDLGTLGGTTSGAYGVSADGSVIVGISQLANNTFHLFRYTNGVMADLGNLGGVSTGVTGLSADGNVMIGSMVHPGDFFARAYKYSNGIVTDLGTLGGLGSSASAVSADGSVIVGTSMFNGSTDTHAFKYFNGVMSDLGTLGGANSQATGVSGDGSVIVGYSDLPVGFGTHVGFIYANGVMTDLQTLFGSGRPDVVNAISEDGSVIVGEQNFPGVTVPHGYSYNLNPVPVSFAWAAAPPTTDWNTGANWTSGVVPGSSNAASFGATTKPNIDITQATAIAGMQFNAGAPAYTFNVAATATANASLTVSGLGVVDQSSNKPQFTVSGLAAKTGTLTFNGATSGDAVLTANAGGTIAYVGTADGANSRVVVNAGGTLDVAGAAGIGLGIGSIEGAGNVVMGSTPLSTGTLNTSTLLSGNISGSDTLTKRGSGTLTLSGTSAVAIMTIVGGALRIGNGGASGFFTGTVINDAQLIFNRSDVVTFGNLILGSGSVTQAGSGITILSASNTYTGATFVAAGTLRVVGSIASSSVTVQNGAILEGSGTVGPLTVNAGGELSPGAGVGSVGTLSAKGAVTLAAGSVFQIDTGASGTDLLAATGTLNVGGIAKFNFTSMPHYGDSAVFATASAVTGTFASVPDPIGGALFPSVSTVTTATGQQLVMTIKAAGYLTLLSNPDADQAAVSAALDGARAAHYQDLKPIYDALDPLQDGALASALDHLVPDAARSLPLISTLQMEDYSQQIWNHLAASGDNQGEPTQSAFQVDTGSLRLAMQDRTPQETDFGLSAVTPASPLPARLGGMDFGKGIGGFLSGSSLNGSVATSAAGGKARINGYLIAAGLDLLATDELLVGASLAYADSDATLAAATPARMRSKAYQGGVYGRYNPGGWFVEWFAGSSGQSITTDRVVAVGGTTFNLHGTTHGMSPTVGIVAGAPIMDGRFTVIPTAGLQWLEASVDGYTESGGAPAMTYDGFSRHALTGRLGFDVRDEFDLGEISLKPSLHVFAVHDFANGPGTITAAFVGAPASLMSFDLAEKSADWVELGAGVEAAIDDQASLAVRYDATAARSDLFSGAWTGALNVRF